MPSRVEISVARRIIGLGLRGANWLFLIWSALVAARSISQSGFENLTQVFSCLQRNFQLRTLAWLAGIVYLAVGFQITSVCRSREKQAELHERFLLGLSRLPAARPGESLHEQGRAIDIVFDADDLWLVVPLARLAGIRWAGERDPVHWER